MKETWYWLLALTLSIFLGGGHLPGHVLAAEGPKAESTQMTALQGPLRSSQMVGMSVKSQQGQNLGKINELVIAPDGMVKYVILSHTNARSKK